MGKRRNSRNAASEEKKPKTDYRDGYSSLVRENAMFLDYYKQLNIVPEAEWDAFVEAMKSDLPSSFRIAAVGTLAVEMKNKLEKEYFKDLEGVEVEGERIEAPKPIDFLPEQMGYQYAATRRQIRKCDAFQQLHQYLVTETECGNIARQEAVSMIPPLFMDIKGHHNVLDMCAAPGSKTLQILEAVHKDLLTQGQTLPPGVVVANDENNKRAYLLVRRTKPQNSPALLVTNHDASYYPTLYTQEGDKHVQLKFDRVLADVPCSGDGTSRKNYDIWRIWTPGAGLGLHPLQCRILERAFDMTKADGRIVYSTCSMNPMENEAVVASILRKYKGKVKLVDVSKELPTLKRTGGLKDWIVTSKNGKTVYENMESVPEDVKNIKETMFPPTEEEAEWMNLERCVRVYHHFQNTGGFFIAVLQKCGDDDEKIKSVEGLMPTKTNKESPFIFVPSESPDVEKLFDYYGIATGFPRDQFLVRQDNNEHKSMFFVSPTVKSILQCSRNKAVKYVYSGVKACTRNYYKHAGEEPDFCNIRLHQEIIPLITPYLGEKSVIDITKDELIHCLDTEFPQFHTFSEPVEKRLRAMSMGGVVFRYVPAEEDNFKCVTYVTAWRAKTSVNVLLAKDERLCLLVKLVGFTKANEIMNTRNMGLKKDDSEAQF